MEIKKIVEWAKQTRDLPRDEKLKWDPRRQSKIEALAGMIIARGEHILKETPRLNGYMEEINDALVNMDGYGITTPISADLARKRSDEANRKQSANPLRP